VVTNLLNQLGDVVYFPEKESGLDSIIILDPQWLTKTFATIISMKNRFARSGRITRAQLKQLVPSRPPLRDACMCV
jgi:hypothetical protein